MVSLFEALCSPPYWPLLYIVAPYVAFVASPNVALLLVVMLPGNRPVMLMVFGDTENVRDGVAVACVADAPYSVFVKVPSLAATET